MTASRPRRPVVGVMGSSTRAYEDLSEPLGRWLASAGLNLLTGGGAGTMEAVSRAFAEVQPRAGVVVGVLPADLPDGIAVEDDPYDDPMYARSSTPITIGTSANRGNVPGWQRAAEAKRKKWT